VKRKRAELVEMDHNALWSQVALAIKMRLRIEMSSVYRSDDDLRRQEQP
jgi:hypothetical protein